MKIASIIASLALSTSAYAAADLDCSAKPISFSRAQKLALPELKTLEAQGFMLVAANLDADCPAVVELISYSQKAHAKATIAVYRDANGAEEVSGPSITAYY